MTRLPGSLLVLSPHLDDGVFGAGELCAANPGAAVVTIFAGFPPPGPVTEWDRAGGFSSAAESVTQRRGEDESSLTQLQARPIWLDFCDYQYGCSPSADAVTSRLAAVIAQQQPTTVVIPMGLVHPDHQLTHAACAPLLRQFPALHWLAYEDALYRLTEGAVAERLTSYRAVGLRPEPVSPASTKPGAKHAAVACYTSQVKAFAGMNGLADVFAPEKLWQLTP